MGQFTGGGLIAGDFNQDGYVDGQDVLHLKACTTGTDPGPPDPGCADADLDGNGDVDAADFTLLQACLAGSYMPVDPGCVQARSGTFALHGLPVDVLPDGHVMLNVRRRIYIPKHARWLQRDPKGYIDGPNLYEGFGGNPLVNLDPEGAGLIAALFGVGYGWSDWEFVKDTLWAFGGSAQAIKDDLSQALTYTVIGDCLPSNSQQRLINLVNAENRWGGTTDAAELWGRALLMHACDSIGATSFNTMANAEIFVFTDNGDAYTLQADSWERVQAAFTTVGQGAGTAVVVLQVGQMTIVVTGSTLAKLDVRLRPPNPAPGSLSLERSAWSISDQVKVSALSQVNRPVPTAAASTGQPMRIMIVADEAGNVAIVPLNDAMSPAGRAGVQLNKAIGDAWERDVIQNVLPQTQTAIQPQITIISGGPSDLRVRLDAVGTDILSGLLRLTDGKASPTAPLTPNQVIVYPELEVFGGTVVGTGKPPYVGGTVIPPTKVDIIRKP